MEDIDVYYIVDAIAYKIERVEMGRAGVISVRAGVSLLREEQLDQLAQVFDTSQNPPEPFVFTDTTIRKSEMIEHYDEAPVEAETPTPIESFFN
jgi:hypothetical protein